MSKNKKLIPELRFPEFVNEKGWEEKRLGTVAEIITGNTPSTTNTINYNGTNLFVSPADINENRYVSQTRATLSDIGFSRTRQIKANSVLFVCIGSTIGKVAQNESKCATNQQINSLIPFEGYSSDFLYSVLEYSAPQISEMAGIHAVPIINKTQFSSVKLLFPKLREQQKIASCLSSLDEMIAAHSQKMKLLKEHKKGLMQNLFPQEGENVPNYRFPEFVNDEAWEEKELFELGETINGLTYSPNDLRNKGLLVLRSSNIQNGRIDLNDCVFVKSEIKGANLSQPNDILVCIRNGSKALIGKNAIIPQDIPLATHGAFMTVFRAKHPKFIFQLFQTKAYDDQVKADLGATINSINGKNFLKYKFFVPKSKEQKKIAVCLSSLDAAIAAQAEKIEQLKFHKKGLMQGLFPK